MLECTGFYTSAEKSQAHINAGAKKVLISAPAKDDTTPTVVFGVNHDILKASDVIVSAGSCTTNSMAAMVKLLDEKFGIKAGFMTTIHAYTGTQMLLDGPRGTKTGRNLRAAAINTIAHSTGAAKAIGKVVPSVNGKLQGHAQRVQVPGRLRHRADHRSEHRDHRRRDQRRLQGCLLRHRLLRLQR